jgi:hypothetical protein
MRFLCVSNGILMVNFTTSEIYALVNEQFDPENTQFLVETSLNQPLSARVVILIYWRVIGISWEHNN